jgi:predicted DNA-binding protein (UPF0278 family)
MSLKVKIRKQARLAIEIVRYLRNSIGKAAEIAEQEKWIQVDAVSGLLDKAIVEIKQEVAVENWAWFFYSKLGYRITDSDEDKELLKKAMIGLFDKSLAILGAEGETKK